jgi:hypothetical protein
MKILQEMLLLLLQELLLLEPLVSLLILQVMTLQEVLPLVLNGEVTITGSAVVAPTGVGLTVSTISPNIIAWAEVDTGTPVTWTPVDLAA